MGRMEKIGLERSEMSCQSLALSALGRVLKSLSPKYAGEKRGAK